MICFYILTKGEHPFGGRNDRVANIAKGDPVYLDNLSDSNDINKRPYVEEALRDPYLQHRPHGTFLNIFRFLFSIF